MPTSDFWRVAKVWYRDRFDPDWVPKTREEAQAILSAAGLDGPFWSLSRD